MKVEGDVQGGAKLGVQTQGQHVVQGQSPVEQLEGKDVPAACGNSQRTAEVHHLTNRGQYDTTVKKRSPSGCLKIISEILSYNT